MLFPHEKESFRHLLQIINFRPALVSGTLALHPLLHVDQQIEAGFLMHLGTLSLFPARSFPCDNTADIFFGVPFAEGTQTDEALLSFAPDRDVLTALDLENVCNDLSFHVFFPVGLCILAHFHFFQLFAADTGFQLLFEF